MKPPIAQSAEISGMQKNSRSPLTRWGIVFGLTIIYLFVSGFLLPTVGVEIIALSTIPIAAAGWYFGLTAGIIASLIAVILNNLLFFIFEGALWYRADQAGFLMSASILLMVGVGFGQIKKYSDVHSRTNDQLRSRERYLSLLRMATNSILSLKSPDNRYYDLITHFANIFVADYGYYFSWDIKQKQVALIASTLPIEQKISSVVLAPNETAEVEAVLQSGRAVIFNTALGSQDIFNTTLFKNLPRPIHFALSIPLITRDGIIGIIVLAYNETRNFTDEEINYAQQGGQHIALALRSIQQEYKIEKQLQEANALANIERILSESQRVGIDAVLQLIVDSAKELIPKTKHVVLHLLDEEQKILIPRAVAGLADGPRSKLNMRLGKGVAGQVLVTGETIYIPDIRIDPRFLGQTLPISYLSLLVAPVKSDERSMGTISIHSEEAGAFNSDDARLLSALGIKATLTLENASLLDTTRQDYKQIKTLYHLAQNLAMPLDPDVILKDTVDFIQDVFKYYHVQIFLKDPGTGNLLARHGAGMVGERLMQQKYYLPVGKGIVGYVAETGEPFFTNNVNDVLFYVSNPLLPDTQSEMALPIQVEGKILGVLDIQEVVSSPISLKQMKLMDAIANQLAVALQKANLYAELQTSLNQEKSMRAQLMQSERLAVIGQLLASVSHELNNPLQAIQNALFLLKQNEENLSEQGKKDLEIILSETERMASLIGRLRATYRPTQMDEFQNVQINTIIKDIQTLVGTYMRHRNVIFELEANPDLPVIGGIPDQLRQVVLNLLMNATDAMPNGGYLMVQTKYAPEEDQILIVVKDTGAGIDPKLLPHIFEPFVTDKNNGTGLGLTITRDIIHQHHGEIKAENVAEGGAIFKVWLPIRKEE